MSVWAKVMECCFFLIIVSEHYIWYWMSCNIPAWWYDSTNCWFQLLARKPWVRANHQEAKRGETAAAVGQVICDMTYSICGSIWPRVFSCCFVFGRWFSVIVLRLVSFPLAWTAFSHLHFHPSSGHTLTFTPSSPCVCVCVCYFASLHVSVFVCVFMWASVNLLNIASMKLTFDSNCVATAIQAILCCDWMRILHTHYDWSHFLVVNCTNNTSK